MDDEAANLKFARCGVSTLEVMLTLPRGELWNGLKEKLIKEGGEPFNKVKKDEVDRNSNGDTPLILAARLCDFQLMQFCSDLENYSGNEIEQIKQNKEIEVAKEIEEAKKIEQAKKIKQTKEIELAKEIEQAKQNFREKLLTHVNNDNMNAFLVALQSALLLLTTGDVPYGFQQFRQFFKGLVEMGDKDEKRRMFRKTTHRKQNALHLLFSIIGKAKNPDSHWQLARDVLEILKEKNIAINPLVEDFRGLTPFLYLIRFCNEQSTWKCFKEYFQTTCSGRWDWKDILRNTDGMDIVHARAGFNSLQLLFKDQSSELKDVLLPENTFVSLFNSQNPPVQFVSSMTLGGPMQKSWGSQKPDPRHQQWTALHFAFKRGHQENMAFLIRRGFSAQATTATGETCTSVALRRGIEPDLVLKAFESAKGAESVAHYVSSLDCVKCALDACSGDCDQEESITEAAANERIQKKWRRNEFLRGLTQDSMSPKETVKHIMWLCFENDDAGLYRDLLHSTVWKACHASDEKILTDKEFIDTFDKNRKGQRVKPPKVTRRQFTLKDYSIVLHAFFTGSRTEQQPLFKYLDNGKIFLYELLQDFTAYKSLTLINLAVRTGRPEMAKALLITRQMDLIPVAVDTIITCRKMIEKEHLVNYYPIKDANNHLKSVKAFAGKVAMNAIDILFRGCSSGQAKLIFLYLQGEMPPTDSLPSSRLENEKGYSTLELVRASKKVDFFATECFQQLVQRMWIKSEPFFKSIVKSDRQVAPAPNSSAGQGNDKDQGNRKSGAKGTSAQSQVQQSSFVMNLRKAVNYFRAPRRKLMSYGFMNAIFIATLVFGISHPSVDFNWTDVVLGCFLLGFVVQEIHEFCIRVTTKGEDYASYIFDVWNFYDILMICFLLGGFSIKGNFVTTGLSKWGSVDDPDAAKISAFKENVWMFFNYKMVMSTALLLACAKFLKILRYVQSIGQNLVIMPTIFVKDLFPFVILLLLFITSFGTFFFVSLTVGRYGFSVNSTTTVRRTDDVLFDLYLRPLLVAFGEFELDGMHDCEGNPGVSGSSHVSCFFAHGVDVFKRFILIFFLFIVNLVMFNMLIARFSNTVSRYDMRSCKIWLSLRDEMLIDFRYLTSLPPPLNVFGSLWILYQNYRTHYSTPSYSNEEETREFYIYQAQRFSHKRHRIQRMHVETIEDDIKEKLEGEDNLNATDIQIQFRRTFEQ